jgi:hypothetical protein
MKQTIFILAFIFAGLSSWGQEVSIIEQDENQIITEKQEEFYFIEKDFYPTDDSWVATLEGFCTNTKKSNLETLFYNFWHTANELGGNAFYVDSLSFSPDTISVSLSVFHLTEEELDANFGLYPANQIYIIGDLTSPKSKGKNIKLNKEKITIHPLEYYMYQNTLENIVEISIGGFFGATHTLMGKEGQLSEYIALSGLQVAPSVYARGGVGISLSTGGLYPLDMNFGQFLVEILKEQ